MSWVKDIPILSHNRLKSYRNFAGWVNILLHASPLSFHPILLSRINLVSSFVSPIFDSRLQSFASLCSCQSQVMNSYVVILYMRTMYFVILRMIYTYILLFGVLCSVYRVLKVSLYNILLKVCRQKCFS